MRVFHPCAGEPAPSAAAATSGAGTGAKGDVVHKSSIVDKVLDADDDKPEPQVPPIKLLLLVFMFACAHCHCCHHTPSVCLLILPKDALFCELQQDRCEDQGSIRWHAARLHHVV